MAVTTLLGPNCAESEDAFDATALRVLALLNTLERLPAGGMSFRGGRGGAVVVIEMVVVAVMPLGSSCSRGRLAGLEADGGVSGGMGASGTADHSSGSSSSSRRRR
jgi:hypothetical protein